MKRLTFKSALLIGAISATMAHARAQGTGGATPSPSGVKSSLQKPGLAATPEAAPAPSTGSATTAPKATQSTGAAISAQANAVNPLAPIPTGVMSPKERAQAQLDLDLIHAAFRGETWNARNLMNKGARVNSADHVYGFTPLMWASKMGHLGTVRLLLARGARPNIKSKSGIRLVLHEGPMRYSNQQVIPDGNMTYFYTRVHYNFWISESGGVTALIAAATAGYNLTVRELLKNGADPNLASADGETPLMSAAYSGNNLAVEALLERGAKINATDKTGQTALLCAAASGSESIARLLLSKGAQADVVWRRFNMTGSQIARMQGFESTSKLLARAETTAKQKKAREADLRAKLSAKKAAPSSEATFLN